MFVSWGFLGRGEGLCNNFRMWRVCFCPVRVPPSRKALHTDDPRLIALRGYRYMQEPCVLLESALSVFVAPSTPRCECPMIDRCAVRHTAIV